MKRTFSALATIACAVVVSQVVAEDLRQPRSVQPVAYRNDYFSLGTNQASPSDRPATPTPPTIPMDETTAVPAEGHGVASISSKSWLGGGDCGCTDACDGGCTDGCGKDDSCTDEPWALCDGDNGLGLKIGGWLAAGYYNKSTGLFNTHPGKLNLTQAWLYFEREADAGDYGWDWGYRIDTLYGTDANSAQAFGNPPGTWDFMNGFDHGIYGWAIPQAYGELARGDMSIKFGHFFTPAGYEVIGATGNFFFSHALTHNNSEPFTHTGVLSTYTASDSLDVYLGWTAGWDTGFERLGDGSNFLGGFSYSGFSDATFTYITTIGDMGDYALGGRGDGYTQHIVFDFDVTENFKYIFQSDYVNLNTGGVSQNNEYGATQYFLYTLNDCWSFGHRFEWWKSDSGFDYGGQAVAPATGTHSYYESTTGLNYKPNGNVIVRPEIRYDWAPALADYKQWIFGVDFILTF
jgi:hypothetical protein